jgi:hypothetical protein
MYENPKDNYVHTYKRERERERDFVLCINTIINFHLIHVGENLFIYSSHGFFWGGGSLPLATPFGMGEGY